MTARLFCKVGELAGAEYQIGDEATIGRGSSNSIVLGTGLVSSRHARIYRDPDRGGYFVEDLGSLNGTRLDGVALGRPERLGDLAVVTFAGAFDFIFQDLDALPRRATEGSDEPRTMIEHEPILPPDLLAGPGTSSVTREAPTRPPFSGTMIERDVPVLPGVLAPEAAVSPPTGEEAAAGRGPRFVLETTGPEGEVRRFELRPGENIVGRLGDCDLKLDDPSISRHHAVVTLTGDRVTVRDLGSTNRTFLGDDPVEGEVELSTGTEVRFGAVHARLVEE